MSMFITAIQNCVDNQTESQPINTQALTIRHIEFQKIQPQTKLLLLKYSNLKRLDIYKCDLRTLENFPYLESLKDLRLASNKLQGTLENIIKLTGLEYLDLSSNIIREVAKLKPLKRIKKLKIFISNNPFQAKQGWKSELNNLNLNIESEQKNSNNEENEIQDMNNFNQQDEIIMFTDIIKRPNIFSREIRRNGYQQTSPMQFYRQKYRMQKQLNKYKLDFQRGRSNLLRKEDDLSMNKQLKRIYSRANLDFGLNYQQISDEEEVPQYLNRGIDSSSDDYGVDNQQVAQELNQDNQHQSESEQDQQQIQSKSDDFNQFQNGLDNQQQDEEQQDQQQELVQQQFDDDGDDDDDQELQISYS